MQGYAGITYIELGGQKRPLKFGTNQTAFFCEQRKIDLKEYTVLMSTGMEDMAVVRDILYSGMWAGDKSEKLPVEFDNFEVGDWIDEAGYANVIQKLSEA